MSKRIKRIRIKRSKTPLDLNDPFQAYLNNRTSGLAMWNDIPEQSKSEYVKQAYKLVEWFKTVQYELKTEIGLGGNVRMFVHANGLKVNIDSRYPYGRNDVFGLIIDFVERINTQRNDDGGTIYYYNNIISEIVNFRYKTQSHDWSPELPLIEFANAQIPRIAADLEKVYKIAAQSEEAKQSKIQDDVNERQQQFKDLISDFTDVFKRYDMFSMEEYVEAWNMALVQSIHD